MGHGVGCSMIIADALVDLLEGLEPLFGGDAEQEWHGMSAFVQSLADNSVASSSRLNLPSLDLVLGESTAGQEVLERGHPAGGRIDGHDSAILAMYALLGQILNRDVSGQFIGSFVLRSRDLRDGVRAVMGEEVPDYLDISDYVWLPGLEFIGDLINHQLGITVDFDVLGAQFLGQPQSGEEFLVLRLVV